MTRTRTRPRTRTRTLYVLRAAAVSVVWLLGALPAMLGVAQCPSARWLHFPCPGCGMTRAVRLFAHGDVAASMAMNPLAVPIALATAAVAAFTVVLTLRRGSPFSLLESRGGRGVVWTFAVLQALSVALWVLRFAGLFGGPVSV
jgi:hypothetical protein